MAHVTGTDLYDLLYDVLVSNTSSNPQMTYSPVLSLNKKLNTTDKRTVGAINEVFKNLTLTNGAFQNFTIDYNNALGDFKANPQLLANLKKSYPSVLEALVQQHSALYGSDLDNPIALPNGKAIAEILLYLTSLSEQSYEVALSINQYQLVGIDLDGKIKPIDANTESDFNTFIGIALESKNTGEQCKVKTLGEISNPAWLLGAGTSFYCGLNGSISANATGYKWMQRIGIAINPTTIRLQPSESIML